MNPRDVHQERHKAESRADDYTMEDFKNDKRVAAMNAGLQKIRTKNRNRLSTGPTQVTNLEGREMRRSDDVDTEDEESDDFLDNTLELDPVYFDYESERKEKVNSMNDLLKNIRSSRKTTASTHVSGVRDNDASSNSEILSNNKDIDAKILSPDEIQSNSDDRRNRKISQHEEKEAVNSMNMFINKFRKAQNLTQGSRTNAPAGANVNGNIVANHINAKSDDGDSETGSGSGSEDDGARETLSVPEEGAVVDAGNTEDESASTAARVEEMNRKMKEIMNRIHAEINGRSPKPQTSAKPAVTKVSTSLPSSLTSNKIYENLHREMLNNKNRKQSSISPDYNVISTHQETHITTNKPSASNKDHYNHVVEDIIQVTTPSQSHPVVTSSQHYTTSHPARSQTHQIVTTTSQVDKTFTTSQPHNISSTVEPDKPFQTRQPHETFASSQDNGAKTSQILEIHTTSQPDAGLTKTTTSQPDARLTKSTTSPPSHQVVAAADLRPTPHLPPPQQVSAASSNQSRPDITHRKLTTSRRLSQVVSSSLHHVTSISVLCFLCLM